MKVVTRQKAEGRRQKDDASLNADQLTHCFKRFPEKILPFDSAQGASWLSEVEDSQRECWVSCFNPI